MNAATAIEVVDQKTGEVTIRPQGFTNEQTELIRRTLCPEATNDELALFEQRCIATGLDPFAGQIYLVKRGNTPATIQTGIDGYRLVAERTGERDGEDAPMWCGADGKWHEVWTDSKPPAVCRVVVYRKGHSRGYYGLAYWSMYSQKKKDGNINSMWTKGGPNMLAKSAEALALRKAFPNELANLHTPELAKEAEYAARNPEDVAALEAAVERSDLAKEIIDELLACISVAQMDALAPRIKELGETELKVVRGIYAQHRETIKKQLEKGAKQ